MVNLFLFAKIEISLLNAAGVGCNLGPQIGTLLGDWSGDGRSLHFALVVDDDASIIFKVNENTVLPSEWLSLANDDCRHDLLSKFGFTLLDGSNEHIASTSGWETIQTALDAIHSNDEQVLGSSVVGTIHHSANWQTKRDAKLGAGGTTTTYMWTNKISLGHLEQWELRILGKKHTSLRHDVVWDQKKSERENRMRIRVMKKHMPGWNGTRVSSS